MSYLLETLKRLEERRQGEEVSDLLAVHGEIKHEPRKRVIWPYVLSVALLANAAVAAWWMVPRQGTGRPTIDKVSVKEKATSTAPGKAVGALAADTTSSASTKGQVEARAIEHPVTKTPTRIDVPVKGPSRDMHNPEAVRPGSSANAPSGTSGISARPQVPLDGRLQTAAKNVAVNEAPSTIKSTLPDLKLSLHSYSAEPGSRLVRIDDKTLSEGDVLPSGVKVEEITPDGVVLTYEGRRFRLGVEQNR